MSGYNDAMSMMDVDDPRRRPEREDPKRRPEIPELKVVKRAIYAGTFDPITNGHVWIIREAVSLFDEIIIGVGDNPAKKTLFTHEERLKLVQASVGWWGPHIRVESLGNRYLVEYASEREAPYIVRGIRNIQDFEYERGMYNVNADLAGTEVRTIFLMPPRDLCEVSSSVVKGLVGPQGWQTMVTKYVPEPVVKALCSKFP